MNILYSDNMLISARSKQYFNYYNKEEEEDNVYGAVIVQSTSRVHPVHMMNAEQRKAAADPQPRPTDPCCESACRLPEATHTPTVNIYYYYSARKLILIYQPTGVEGWVDL